MRPSRSGSTVGMTLRLPTDVYQVYVDIADRANMIALQNGQRANSTVQDVIRHRLSSLPAVKVKIAGRVNEK